MGDSLITVIAIFLAAILMFVFPLMSLSERTDNISQLAVQTATTEFVDRIKTTGKLTLDDYQKYINTIVATGNSFETDILIQQLDENPGVKTTQAETTKIGENVYYNMYTSQVEEKLNSKGRITLKEGDIVEPGQVIGYVGSTGYGKEGTSGKFPPHLHFGLYKYDGRCEWAFNPYPHLRRWEKEKQ